MDKNQLIVSANLIPQVHSSSFEEYHAKSDLLIDKMNSLMLERADLKTLIGENNVDMMKDNHSNHVRFIGSILKNYNANVLVESVLWVFRAYRSHGFTSNYWSAQINAWIMILKEELTPESYLEIRPYYEWLQINIPLFVSITDIELSASNSLDK